MLIGTVARIRKWLNIRDDLYSIYSKTDSWLQEGDLNNTIQFLNKISGINSKLNGFEKEELESFITLKNLQTTIAKNNRKLNSLTESEINSLRKLVLADKGRATVQARGIFNFFYNENYPPKEVGK